ncbi:MAG: hypothetical protein HYS81_02530 [Candidatus Aenigmatarchaeota archaeon]|nr:MAG: hypothetical protein HYS81_02530 [Candidatus Aenigmarchaeota archaeon]
MKFYDLHVHAQDLEKTVEVAATLGFSGLAVVEYHQKFDAFRELRKRLRDASQKSGLELVGAVEIQADSIKTLKRALAKYREIAELVLVSGGDYAINRAAAEDGRVDVIAHPEFKRVDSGIDHVVTQSAAQNGVALELNMGELLTTYKRVRTHVLNHMERNVMLCKEFGTPIVVTSGAKDAWGLRDPRELAALAQILGLTLEESMRAVSDTCEARVQANKKKLAGKILYKGVEVEE